MFRFIILSGLIASAIAGYGNYGRSYGYQSVGAPIQAAIQTRRSLSFLDVPTTYSAPTPLNIDVPASTSPLNVLLRSASSPLNVQTLHEGSAGSYASSSSVDAPHIRQHTVFRPIQQQVREVVQPLRFIKQEVLPTEEHVQQVVARGYQQPLQQKLAFAPLRLVQLQQAPLLKSGYYDY